MVQLYKKIVNNAYMKILHLFNDKIDSHSYISHKAILRNIRKINIGRNVMIDEYAIIDAKGSSCNQISIGDNCIIHEFTNLKAFDGSIEIGNNCTINSFALIYGCEKGVHIGNGVRIATGCSMVANSHIFDDPTLYIYEQGVSSKGIIIEDDVWLGSGVRIIDGVTIGKGSVLGANSVVTKNIPPYSVAVGVPAKVIKSRLKNS